MKVCKVLYIFLWGISTVAMSYYIQKPVLKHVDSNVKLLGIYTL